MEQVSFDNRISSGARFGGPVHASSDRRALGGVAHETLCGIWLERPKEHPKGTPVTCLNCRKW